MAIISMKAAVAIGALAAFASPVLAQQAVTNEELFAAYCVGQSNQSIAAFNEAIKREAANASASCRDLSAAQCRETNLAILRAIVADTAKDSERYRTYVLALDPLRSEAVSTALIAAEARGRIDERDCQSHVQQSCQGAKDFASCYERHDSCARASRCDQASGLPF